VCQKAIVYKTRHETIAGKYAKPPFQVSNIHIHVPTPKSWMSDVICV
jgi:hypothetical protein